MNTTDSPNIHRYLDEVFAGVVSMPESQDLREELRGNLTARVSELVAGGLDEQAAAKTAISIVVGFVWSWLALVAGLIVFMLVLARMLFPTSSKDN